MTTTGNAQLSVAAIQALVDHEGPHAPSWAFSGCACGWTVTDVSEGRRLPQYLAHVLSVLAASDGT